MSWRILKEQDSDPVDGVEQLDQRRIMYHTANWQLAEEWVDDTPPFNHPSLSADRIVQHVWGSRYIDDCILHRQDAGADGSGSTDR